MYLLDWPSPDPVDALALEAALLEWAEHTGEEFLWIWTLSTWAVILGRSSQPEQEVFVETCLQDRVPILRRVSGGGTVLQGPGCLNFSLILQRARDPSFRSVAGTLDWILDSLVAALQPLCPTLSRAGTGDLVLGDRKVCGTAQRRLHRALLFHGSILWGMDLTRMERYLRRPPRQPFYRRDRSHEAFLTQLPLPPDRIRACLLQIWPVDQTWDPFANKAFVQVFDQIRTWWDHPRWRIREVEGVRKVTTMGA